jgi:hypothetical protein
MIVQVVANTVALGFLRMSATNARVFLAELRDGRSPTVAVGDEGGTVEIEYEITDAGPAFLVRKAGERHALHRCVIGPYFDLKTLADALLADLGA